ncbi:MAG: DUF971 domain-containing protein [Proteobacteria bacterium]|nr:DUF971 domain-containing protein [Pseudomonadota bacterium]
MDENNTCRPSEIRLGADKKTLKITFDDGLSAEITAELLRVRSPSAEVRGHTPDERKTVPGKRDVMIIGIEPVGNYAIRLTFDDMHDSGIYSWPLLHHFASEQSTIFAEYLAELEAKGLGRERARRT